MNVVALSWRLHAWPLDGRGAARGRTTRAALLLEVRTEAGAIGLGEAAPLPGLSRDTLDDVTRAFAAIAVPLEVEDVAAVARVAACDAPAARFAIETALLSAMASERGTTIAKLLGSGGEALPVAHVVDDVDEAVRAVASGVRTLKLKVGAGDEARIRAIAAAVPGARLRLDANRSWPRESVHPQMTALADLPIDFVEEPCADAASLGELPLPVALDESLADGVEPVADAVVLKPTVLGGFAACRAIAERARAAGAAVVVSHALEGPVGTAACCELALALDGTVAAGLGPHAALDAWPVAVPHLARAGYVVPAPGLDASVFARIDDDELSIDAAAREAGDAIAVVPLTFAEAARRAHAMSSATRGGRNVRARVVVATPEVETVSAVHAALAGRWPIALLHAKLPPDELARQREVIAAATLPEDTAFVLFTSGSSGPARAVAIGRAAAAAAARANALHLGWRDDDRWLCALSLAHAGGLAIVVRCLAARRPMVLADDVARAVVDQRCTIASLVPSQLAALLDDPAWRPPAHLRAVLLGGAAASPALLDEAARRGVPFLVTYGMTEALGQVATADPARAGDPRALPRPLAGVAIAGGTTAEPARIHVRGPMLATGYVDGAPIAPAFATGDLGYLDGGAIRVVGRIDDVIVSGGAKVHPSTIEAVVAASPGVRGACAFAVPDERWGHIVGLAIATDDSFELAAALARWHAALAPHARPRELAVARALPLSPNGKLDRRAAAALPRSPIRY